MSELFQALAFIGMSGLLTLTMLCLLYTVLTYEGQSFPFTC